MFRYFFTHKEKATRSLYGRAKAKGTTYDDEELIDGKYKCLDPAKREAIFGNLKMNCIILDLSL